MFGELGCVNPFIARVMGTVGVRRLGSSRIITREACSVRSGQRSGMLVVDKTAHGTFMVPLVKFGISLVSSL
jgi:hypothetical protein